ncbi:endonuclease MutS2 [Fictibacillus phosphorivorans]|uniref:endonuclease MutS2 n=1 Tax=Fictibacillus phosphorivorans TaxID=1221500 RepID=UPI001293A370|nr:endonuclease MutS2 [Fictibacillus phosphorivorans]MQR94154.1 endonuclease MutS2 [Fictibacillus phosphorivorans]
MNTQTINMLEYNKIKEQLASHALNKATKEQIEKLQPSSNLSVIRSWMLDTTEAKRILEKSASVPIANLNGLEQVLEIPKKGLNLTPEQLTLIFGLLENVSRMQRFMKDKASVGPGVSSYAYSMFDLSDLKEEIYRCIRNGRVDDHASKALLKVRKKITVVEERIKSKLDNMMKSSVYRDMLQDQIVSMRDGRYVIPVKSKYKRNIDGQVLDSSSSGATVYIEPHDIRKLQTEISMLRAEEEIEISMILGVLTGMVASYERELHITIEAMIHYDFIFAKAKYSRTLDAKLVALNQENRIKIVNGKHPLIGEKCVPLHFNLGINYQSLIITGPNTGGKTVAIKTVGLLTLMVQTGLHVPVDEGSEFAVFRDVFVDIGDGQSIEQSLSTFSSHMTTIISILKDAGPQDLVILDELGAGTDPSEGMGLAVAILERLYSKGSMILATTHYSEIKEFASATPGFENGSMDFNLETLQPTYSLIIGKAGKSQAFSIAKKLGMDDEIIHRAQLISGKESYPHVDKDDSSMFSTDEFIQLKNLRDKAQSKVKKYQEKPLKTGEQLGEVFHIGDRVFVSSLKAAGIVYKLENDHGELGVLVGESKHIIHKKRLKLHIESKMLYPDNYDMDIVFESKENRKKNNSMNKRHIEGLSIERDDH